MIFEPGDRCIYDLRKLKSNVVDDTTPVADRMDEPISGAKVACSAASSARFLLEETPTPSIAVPESFITAFTSAKSTLTSPGIWKKEQ